MVRGWPATYPGSVHAATAAWLATLEVELLATAARHGPLHGRVRPVQRPWSYALDSLESERQALLEVGR